MKKKSFILIISSLIVLALFALNYLPKFYPQIGTEYSKDFDKEIFNNISLGETKKVIDSLLGPPIYKSIDNTNIDSIKQTYWYTNSTSGLFIYEKYVLQFYENKVVNKISVLDID